MYVCMYKRYKYIYIYIYTYIYIHIYIYGICGNGLVTPILVSMGGLASTGNTGESFRLCWICGRTWNLLRPPCLAAQETVLHKLVLQNERQGKGVVIPRVAPRFVFDWFSTFGLWLSVFGSRFSDWGFRVLVGLWLCCRTLNGPQTGHTQVPQRFQSIQVWQSTGLTEKARLYPCYRKSWNASSTTFSSAARARFTHCSLTVDRLFTASSPLSW